MRYLHTMVRVTDLEESLGFWRDKLGLKEIRRSESEKGRFTLVFLGPDENSEAQVELTHNWDTKQYAIGDGYGHVALGTDDIYATCAAIRAAGGNRVEA